MKKTIITYSLLAAFSISSGICQSLEETISRYTTDNGSGYLQPLGDAFGANLNTGLYHSADIPKVGLRIRLSVETMLTLVSDDQKVFTATTQGFFEPVQSIETATVFGDKGARVQGNAGTVYALPDGFAVNQFPTAVPQLTVGSFLGTEASLRWFKADIGDNYGELSLTGFGLRHSISQYLLLFPIDISAHFFRQSFKLGDIIDANATSFGVEASKAFTIIEIYGGLSYESANLDISYDFEEPDGSLTPVAFSLDAENSVRLTTGLSFNFPFFNLHIDYGLGSTKVAGLGATIGL